MIKTPITAHTATIDGKRYAIIRDADGATLVQGVDVEIAYDLVFRVNMYDELVKACEAVLTAIDGGEKGQ